MLAITQALCVALQRRVVQGWVGQVSSMLCNCAAFGGCVVQLCFRWAAAGSQTSNQILGHSPGKDLGAPVSWKIRAHLPQKSHWDKKNAPDETRKLQSPRNLLLLLCFTTYPSTQVTSCHNFHSVASPRAAHRTEYSCSKQNSCS